MGSLFSFLDGFFKNQKKQQAQVPFIHEQIDLKQYPMGSLLDWHKGNVSSEMINAINKAYNDRIISGRSVTNSVSIMQSSHSNGWLMHCSSHKFVDLDYKHLAFYLQDKIKKQNYTLNLGEVKSHERNPNIETITKYYLKPSLRIRFDKESDSKLANQLFGNITIEYKSIDGNPSEFKFMANAYQDSKYMPPQDFEGLKNLIFN